MKRRFFVIAQPRIGVENRLASVTELIDKVKRSIDIMIKHLLLFLHLIRLKIDSIKVNAAQFESLTFVRSGKQN